MDIRSTTTSLPKASTAYLFGSFLNSASPNDIDVLLVYDPEVCEPALAYELHKDFVDRLQTAVGIDVHVTLLTKDEERDCHFVEDSCAVPIELIDSARLLK